MSRLTPEEEAEVLRMRTGRLETTKIVVDDVTTEYVEAARYLALEDKLAEARRALALINAWRMEYIGHLIERDAAERLRQLLAVVGETDATGAATRGIARSLDIRKAVWEV
jgi:hypothetical protein